MRDKFLIFSLIFSFSLFVFLIFPTDSFAATQSVIGRVGAGLTSAYATGTVTSTGNDAQCGGVGFVYGTAPGVYTATSSDFTGYATSTAFAVTSGVLSKGTIYYGKTYCTTSDARVWSADERTFLTGVDAPSGLASQSTEDSIKIMWTAGTGADKTVVRYNDGTTYPTATSSGSGGDFTVSTNMTFYNLPREHTYYFSLWSSTTDTLLSTTSDSYVTTRATTLSAVGGRSWITPTIYSDSLVINAGAATTKSREVTLALKAGDATLMTICNRSDFLNCSLENYATTKTWTLIEGDGVKTVYAKFISSDGLNSDAVSDTITLQTVVEAAPTPVVPAPTPEPIVEPISEPTPEPTPAPVEKPVSEMNKAELTAKIAEIMAQIKALQVQLAELKEAVIFEVNLKYGDRGDEVVNLQEILIEEGLLGQGLNTGWFGSLTKAAVIKFQEKYAEDILIPSGLVKGTGFVGSSTRAKLNELLGK